jgi:ATP-dependent DNA helicase RecG
MASNPRNKQIASIFKEAGIIEKYGSGIKRVIQSMTESGALPPVFEIIAQNFKVTLFPGGGVSGGVSGGVNDLLIYIKNNPGKKSKEIKTALNLPQRTLERWLKELREQNKIIFQGAPKTGGYFPLDDT